MSHPNNPAFAEQPRSANGYPSELNMGLNVGYSSHPSRPTARVLIQERIQFHRRAITDLEALDRALPLELPLSADEALWKLLLAA